MNNETDPLQPQPPTIIRNIVWFWRYGLKHWPYVLVAAVIVIGGYYYNSSGSNSEDTIEEMLG